MPRRADAEGRGVASLHTRLLQRLVRHRCAPLASATRAAGVPPRPRNLRPGGLARQSWRPRRPPRRGPRRSGPPRIRPSAGRRATHHGRHTGGAHTRAGAPSRLTPANAPGRHRRTGLCAPDSTGRDARPSGPPRDGPAAGRPATVPPPPPVRAADASSRARGRPAPQPTRPRARRKYTAGPSA